VCAAGAPFGLRPEAILPAYGIAEATVAVSFSQCGGGLVVDQVDADMLAVLRRAVPATTGNTRRLASLRPLLDGVQARIVDVDGAVEPIRGVGIIEVRGDPVTSGYVTTGGFMAAQDDQGWFSTGDLGYLTEQGHVVVESNQIDDLLQVRRIKHEVAHEVVTEVAARPRNVVVLAPGAIPKTPSGKLRRAYALSLVT
jgi:fatty-acyl-CoA synthase